MTTVCRLQMHSAMQKMYVDNDDAMVPYLHANVLHVNFAYVS